MYILSQPPTSPPPMKNSGCVPKLIQESFYEYTQLLHWYSRLQENLFCFSETQWRCKFPSMLISQSFLFVCFKCMINFQWLASNISKFFSLKDTSNKNCVCVLHQWCRRAALTASPPPKKKTVTITLRNTDNIKCEKNVLLVHNKSDFSASYSKTTYYTVLLEQCHQLHDFTLSVLDGFMGRLFDEL